MSDTSLVSLAARNPVPPLHGVGAKFVRISDKSQERESQHQAIDNWLHRRKASVEEHNIFEFVCKRRNTTKHVDFERLIEWAQAGRIQWFVCADLDRFGSKDPYQLMSNLGRVRDAGCQIWSVADDRIMNDGSDEAILMACIKGITSEKECWVKSSRAHNSKISHAQLGRWNGGPIPYGFDVECRRDDRILWRYVLEKATPVIEVDEKGRKSKRYVFEATLIEGDTETKVDAMPSRNRKVGEFAYLVESLRTERKEAIQLIFEWSVIDQLPHYTVSKRLNERGLPVVHGAAWYPEKIKHILKNPLYQGKPASYKTTQSGYHRYAGRDEETGTHIMGKAPDKSGKGGKYARSEWIETKNPIVPIVDPALSDLAIDGAMKTERRKKAPRSASIWLSGLAVCERCGLPMTGNSPQPSKNRKTLHRTYVCSNYLKDKVHNSSGCRAHRVQHDVIEHYLTRYLADLGKTLEDYKATHHNPQRLIALLKKSEQARSLLEDYATRLDGLISKIQPDAVDQYSQWARLKPPFDVPFLVGQDIPAEWSDDAVRILNIPNLLAYYEGFSGHRKAEVEKIIRDKETEFDNLVGQFASLTNARARDRANALIEHLDIEIQRLKAELPNLDVKVSSVYEELCQLHTRVAEARLAIQIGSDEAKGDAARRAIKEIRLTFRYEAHSAREWSKVDSILIVPHVGESTRFAVEGLKSAGRPKGHKVGQPVNNESPVTSEAHRT